MGCGLCQKRAAEAAARAANVRVVQNSTPQPCNYNMSHIEGWEAKLECIKQGEFYGTLNLSLQTLNGYLGVLKTIKNNPDSLCNFIGVLEMISQEVTKATILNLC